jgi:hypothetical protein
MLGPYILKEVNRNGAEENCYCNENPLIESFISDILREENPEEKMEVFLYCEDGPLTSSIISRVIKENMETTIPEEEIKKMEEELRLPEELLGEEGVRAVIVTQGIENGHERIMPAMLI